MSAGSSRDQPASGGGRGGAMMVATKVGNYFVDSYTKPHTWAWGQTNPATGHPGHARLDVPVDHSNVWEFGEALRKHPRVVSISNGGLSNQGQ